MARLRAQHYLEQRLLKTASRADYRDRRFRGARNGLPVPVPGYYLWQGDQRRSEQKWLDDVFELAEGQETALVTREHPPHTCLMCGELIATDEDEVQVSGTYHHVSYLACQARSWQAVRGSGSPSSCSYGGMIERVLQPPSHQEDTMASDTTQLVRAFRDKGYSVEQAKRRGHWLVRDPHQGTLVTVMPATPSDHRGLIAARVVLSKVPDLRAQAKERRKAAMAQTPAPPAARFSNAPAEQASTASPAERAAASAATSMPSLHDGELQANAWYLYENIRAEAEQAGTTVSHDGSEGWLWHGWISTKAKELWPLIPASSTSPERRVIMTTLSEYLRNTQHIVLLRSHGPVHPGEYWVAQAWDDSAAVSFWRARQGARHGTSTRRVKLTVSAQIREALDAWLDELHRTTIRFTPRELHARMPAVNKISLTGGLRDLAKDSTSTLTSTGRGEYHYTRSERKDESMPAATGRETSGRNSQIKLAVLRDMQAHPHEIRSIQEVADSVSGPESSVARTLREWSDNAEVGVSLVSRGLYTYRPRDGQPAATPAPVGVVAAEQPAAPSEPVPAAPESRPAAQKPKGKIAEILAINPQAPLYVEVFRSASTGIVVVADENGDMHEIAPRS